MKYYEFLFFEYHQKKYICRDIYFPKFSSRFIVSCESLENALIDEDGGYNSPEAQYIDEKIFFYLPDKLICSPCKEIVKFVEEVIE